MPMNKPNQNTSSYEAPKKWKTLTTTDVKDELVPIVPDTNYKTTDSRVLDSRDSTSYSTLPSIVSILLLTSVPDLPAPPLPLNTREFTTNELYNKKVCHESNKLPLETHNSPVLQRNETVAQNSSASCQTATPLTSWKQQKPSDYYFQKEQQPKQITYHVQSVGQSFPDWSVHNLQMQSTTPTPSSKMDFRYTQQISPSKRQPILHTDAEQTGKCNKSITSKQNTRFPQALESNIESSSSINDSRSLRKISTQKHGQAYLAHFKVGVNTESFDLNSSSANSPKKRKYHDIISYNPKFFEDSYKKKEKRLRETSGVYRKKILFNQEQQPKEKPDS